MSLINLDYMLIKFLEYLLLIYTKRYFIWNKIKLEFETLKKLSKI